MVDLKQERGDNMSANEGDLPDLSGYGYSEAEIKAYRAIAKEKHEFEKVSKSLTARCCRKAGITYFQAVSVKATIYYKKRRVIAWLKAIPLIIDRWIDALNAWLLKL